MRLLKLCIIITLLGVYHFILGLMTFTLFQGHMCVRTIICNSVHRYLSTIIIQFINTFPPSFKHMVPTYIEKIRHSMFCVTGVYLRDLTNRIFSILHLTVIHLSIGCFGFFYVCVCVCVCVGVWAIMYVYMYVVCVCVCVCDCVHMCKLCLFFFSSCLQLMPELSICFQL